MSTLNSYWEKLILTRIGKDADINIARVFIMMQNKTSTACDNIILTYPG